MMINAFELSNRNKNKIDSDNRQKYKSYRIERRKYPSILLNAKIEPNNWGMIEKISNDSDINSMKN